MNKIVKYSLAALLSVGISNSCLAALINDGGTFNGTNVGGVDIFEIATDALDNSSWQKELEWVQDVLDSTATYVIKTEPTPYYATDATNVYALQLKQAPDYWILKNSTWWALFSNDADLDWAFLIRHLFHRE